mgnify:CR=1 FL=1
MKKQVGKKENNQKTKKIVVSILLVLIILIAMLGIWLWFVITDKSYTVEEVGEHQYFKLYEQEQYGIIDKNGNIVIEPQYDMIQIPNPSKAIFICYSNYQSGKEDYKTIVVNDKKEVLFSKYEQVTALAFKDASVDEVPFEKSVLRYKQDGKYGIIDFSGKELTRPIYDSMESLSYKEGCLLVSQEGKYGVININGKEMVEVTYDSITADGYYEETDKYQKAGFIVANKTEQGYRYGYITYQGELLLEAKYNEIDRVTEIKGEDIYLLAFENGQATIMKNKENVTTEKYEEVEYNSTYDMFIVQKTGKEGVITREGKTILPPEYDTVLFVNDGIQTQKEGTIELYNFQGEKQEYEEISYISVKDTPYSIAVKEDQLYGVVDENKNPILNMQYTYIEYAFGDNFIVTQDGKVGIINEKQEQKIPFTYGVIQKLKNANVLQAIDTTTNTTDLYNESLEKVASLPNATVYVEDNYIKISTDTERKYFDKQGNEIQNTSIFTENILFAYQENGKWGFKNKEGNMVIEPVYDMVTECNSYGFAGIKQNDKWGVVDKNGNILVEPVYAINWDEPEFIGKYCRLNFGYGLEYYTDELIEE